MQSLYIYIYFKLVIGHFGEEKNSCLGHNATESDGYSKYFWHNQHGIQSSYIISGERKLVEELPAYRAVSVSSISSGLHFHLCVFGFCFDSRALLHVSQLRRVIQKSLMLRKLEKLTLKTLKMEITNPFIDSLLKQKLKCPFCPYL